MKQTNSVDNIECPYCGHRFSGRNACNGNMDCYSVVCPYCGKEMSISMSIEYLAEEIEQD